jgi:serine/threonine-protein kinase RsbT
MSITEPTTRTLFKSSVTIQNEKDAAILQCLVNEQATEIHMGLLNKTKLITAASELVRNMLKYAGGGQALVEAISYSDETGIRITFTDEGPGIPDIALVMQDGYSTANTLGMGLPGAKRLADEFSIMSQVNRGTTVVITKWTND